MANIRRLVKLAAEEDMFVRLDMEDHRVTTDTIDVVVALHEEGLTNVGTVLQGRLFRTLGDIDALETTLGPALITGFARAFTSNQRRSRSRGTGTLLTRPTLPLTACWMQVRMLELPAMTSRSSITHLCPVVSRHGSGRR